MITLQKTNKYGNRKTTVDGITFDSAKEAARYCELKMLARAGQISDLTLQKEYELQPAFNKNGKHYRKITYIADFTYFDERTQEFIVEDVKGHKTKEYLLKRKIFEYQYPNLTIKET